MPRPKLHPDPRTQKAIDILLLRDPTMSVPRAMRAAGFTVEESLERSKQMWVRRRLPARKSTMMSSDSHAATSTSSTSTQHQNRTVADANAFELVAAAESAGVSSSSIHNLEAPDRNVSITYCATLDHKLQAWIFLRRLDFIEIVQNSSLPLNISMQRKYLEQSVQILHSLAGKIVGDSSGGNKILVHPDSITVDNIIVCDPTSMSIHDDDQCDGRAMSAYFIRDDGPSFCHECEEIEAHKKHAAMHAFARVAYAVCMMGNGPSLPDFPFLRNDVNSSSTNVPKLALSLQQQQVVDESGGTGDDEEDEIMDVMRKSYRATENEDGNNSEFTSAMIDAGIPLPIRRFIIDLMAEEYGGIFRSDHKFASFVDVLSDLTQMLDNPDVFLHGSAPDQWKLDFGDKLYGRDAEMEALMNAANRVVGIWDDPFVGGAARTKLNKTEVVMVSGHPGAGKSRLVRVGGKQLEERGWCFLQCKFDRVVQPEPLSILAHAFNVYFSRYGQCPNHGIGKSSPAAKSICSCPGRSRQLHDRLTSMISPEGLDMLAMYIPSLRGVIDIALPAVIPDMNESLMAALFGALLQAISSKDAPIVFFMDDLQWADPLSLSLIMALTKETHSASLQLSLSSADVQKKNDIFDTEQDMHILFVGSYREQTVYDNQPLAKALRKLKNDVSINMTAITLPGMTLETLNELLSFTLSLPERRVRQLSELVLQKTDGLPLFVIEFIRALTVDNLLTHSFAKGWEWDSDSIEIFPITESVAELFASKLRRLPNDILLGMQIVSCFGCQVDQHILDLVQNYDGESSVDIQGALNVAIQEGLVERAAHLFSFSHDLIQKAAIDSIREDDLAPLLRKLIASLEKKVSATESCDSILFVVVDLINRIGIETITCPRERARFAELNSLAGSKAIAVPDFAGAAMYAERGIALLSEICWETQYDLSLKLHEIAVISHFSNRTGDRGQLMDRIHTVFARAHNISDKFNTHRIWTRLLSLTNFSGAIEESLGALEQLGEPLDVAYVDNIQVYKELERQKERFSEKSEMLLTHVLEDQNKKNAMKIMSSLILYYTQSKSSLGAFVSCRMMEITMNYGYCEESIIGAVAFAASLVSSLGDIDGGNYWGRKAMTLMKLCGNQSHIPTMSLGLFGTVFVWTDPIQTTLDFLAQGIRSSFFLGDVEFAMVNTYVYIARSYNSGKKIDVLTREVEALARQHGISLDIDNDVSSDSPEILQYYMLPVYNILCDLREAELPKHELRLVENYDILNIAIEKKQFACFHAVITNLTVTEFMMRNMDCALKCTDMYFEQFEARKLQMMYICIYNVFYDGLINFYFMGQTGDSRYLERGGNALSNMREWVRHSEWNFKNKLLLMQAEYYKVMKNSKMAANCYDASITAARDHKFIHEEAMANELAGIFHLEQGQHQRAIAYFTQSVKCYKKWGAHAIARRIEAVMKHELNRT